MHPSYNPTAKTLLAGLLLVLAGAIPSHAQVTTRQQSAIRAHCRSDFMSNCPGVKPANGGLVLCLQQNVGKLSAACKAAVIATMPAAAPQRN